MNELIEAVKLSENEIESFRNDVMEGLRSEPKKLHSKYFYDAQGDDLFRQIMQLPEYYLTNCEMEIFEKQCSQMAEVLRNFKDFDLIELGAGDASKSFHLLRCLMENKLPFTYIPIDISGNIINLLHDQLPAKLPGIRIQGLQGDYFDALQKAVASSERQKLLMFLGGNIGNMPPDEALQFCIKLREHLSPGDLLLIGFDLKKDPWLIFKAYNDRAGVTEKFNLNLLSRINRELDADFDINHFHHYESYDPETGACKSYLISNTDQLVTIAGESFAFRKDEYIFTETSHKYAPAQVDSLAGASGFQPVLKLTDTKGWFTDVIWRAV